MVDAGIASVDLPRGSLLRTALRSPSFVAGAVITLIFIGLALVSFVWTPFNFATQDIPNKLHAPTALHWFGTDQYGRDVFSQILVGARTSIAVAFIAVGIGVAVGVPLGLWAAAMRVAAATAVLTRLR